MKLEDFLELNLIQSTCGRVVIIAVETNLKFNEGVDIWELTHCFHVVVFTLGSCWWSRAGRVDPGHEQRVLLRMYTSGE